MHGWLASPHGDSIRAAHFRRRLGGRGSSGAAAAEDEAEAAAAADVRAAVGREGGLLDAVCELALASPRAPAGGGATWAEYNLPEDCQRSAMGVLTTLVARHPGNQVWRKRFAPC